MMGEGDCVTLNEGLIRFRSGPERFRGRRRKILFQGGTKQGHFPVASLSKSCVNKSCYCRHPVIVLEC